MVKKNNNDIMFLKIPDGKDIKFIEFAKQVLFIKLQRAKAKRKK